MSLIKDIANETIEKLRDEFSTTQLMDLCQNIKDETEYGACASKSDFIGMVAADLLDFNALEQTKETEEKRNRYRKIVSSLAINRLP